MLAIEIYGHWREISEWLQKNSSYDLLPTLKAAMQELMGMSKQEKGEFDTEQEFVDFVAEIETGNVLFLNILLDSSEQNFEALKHV